MRSDETRHSDRPPERHSSLPTWKGRPPWRRDAALKAAGLQGRPMAVREPRRTVPEAQERKAQVRRESTPWREQPADSRTAARMR